MILIKTFRNPAKTFGKFLAETSAGQIPDGAFLAAKKIITDSIGVIIGGMAEPDIQAMVLALGVDGKGDIPILGTDIKTSKELASLIYGTAGTVLEMDEGHQFAKGHPGMHILPALLSATHGNPVSSQEFLRAFILGYDVGARIGLASSLNPNMHPHGTWGGIGATAALGVLEGLGAEDMAEVLNIASSLTLATSRKTMLEGGTVRNVYTGYANQMAHLCLTLFKSGFNGEEDGIGSVFGDVVSNHFDHDLAFDALGERFEVCRNYFKLHACCRYNHAALDGLLHLMATHPELRNLNTIASIDVESYNLAAELSDPKPRNVLASKFSIPFAIATTLYHQSSDVLSFTETARQNETIQNLASKVQVTENKDMTAKLPDLRPATVKIKMADGASLETGVETNRGDWQDPYPEKDLRDKFISLVSRIYTAKDAANVFGQLMMLEKHNLNDLLAALRKKD